NTTETHGGRGARGRTLSCPAWCAGSGRCWRRCPRYVRDCSGDESCGRKQNHRRQCSADRSGSITWPFDPPKVRSRGRVFHTSSARAADQRGSSPNLRDLARMEDVLRESSTEGLSFDLQDSRTDRSAAVTESHLGRTSGGGWRFPEPPSPTSCVAPLRIPRRSDK